MGEYVLKKKSLDFAIRIVELHKILAEERRAYALSNQIVRAGSSVGAMIREAEHSESRADFIHKMAIAQKEINETLYWLELLHATDYLTTDEYTKLETDASEILRMLTKALLTAKRNRKNSPP
ncbi:MAG: four helix bundle protein [Bacteroidales bacterium]